MKSSSLLTTGCALFSMFFGAGNLIFPLLIGCQTDHPWWAIAGLTLTAVVVPFVGLAAMMLFQANTNRFFGVIGKVPGFALLLLLQLILGPLGVIPRLVTLMHALARPYLFDISLPFFSALCVAVIFALSIKKHRLIHFLGAILTPILLLSLLGLFLASLFQQPSLTTLESTTYESFTSGLLGGYNTMDLIAAFLFATVVLPHFQKEKTPRQKIFFSSLIAAFLLFLTYVGLVFIAVRHGSALQSAPEQLLSGIAHMLLGPLGGLIAAVAVITACLTTAMTLTSIFADYVSHDLAKGKLSSLQGLMITAVITALCANLGFSGIAAFLSPILQVVYPGLIVLAVYNLLQALLKNSARKSGIS